jgi:TetR/AcrR family transcriptional regulator, tetracycline repressor protein
MGCVHNARPTSPATKAARRGRPRRGEQSLTKDRILKVAARLINKMGAEQVTMRGIAVDLGVDPMSLYNHVQNKEALLDGVALDFLDTLPTPAPTGDLGTDITALANAFRRAATGQPQVATLLLTRQLGSMTGLALTDAALGVLRAAGFSPDQAVHAFRSVFAFLVGTVLRESSIGPTFSGQNLGGLHERESELASAGLQHAAEAAHQLATCDHDEEFEFGMSLLISGLDGLRRRPRRS